MRTCSAILSGVVLLGGLVYLAPAADPSYRSPYTVKFTHPVAELLADIEHGRRGDVHDEAAVPFPEWYSRHIREKFGAWGPPARHYPAPTGVFNRPVAWQRERVLAVALRFQGYGYQHHHVPDWSPPAGWPWKETAVGHNGKGVDCSNFSSFVYNLGFGIKPTGNVKDQSEQLEVPGPGPGRQVRAERINRPASYAELTKVLRTGDLLYIRGKEDGPVTHVVLWVGPIGHSPDGTPLIMDSHGEGVKDSNGVSIPCGIHLRPFREGSWYARCFSHAHRLLHGD